MKKFLILASLFFVSCAQETLDYENVTTTAKKEEKCNLLNTIDSSAIIQNRFLEVNIPSLSSETFNNQRSLDFLPKCILEQIKLFSKDDFRTVGLDQPLRTDLYCPNNPNNLPCRKLEYIGVSDSYVIISYLQVCKSCADFANNLLVLKYKGSEVLDMWIGNVNPYVLHNATLESYDFSEVNLVNLDTIINYIENKYNNAPEELHILDEIVI